VAKNEIILSKNENENKKSCQREKAELLDFWIKSHVKKATSKFIEP
jgi:hypothetical protein